MHHQPFAALKNCLSHEDWLQRVIMKKCSCGITSTDKLRVALKQPMKARKVESPLHALREAVKALTAAKLVDMQEGAMAEKKGG